ncbi:MAG TPA: GxxExxY protein [Gemmatimonadaceae bacterium]|nr:GxxExxY protein [Gemmatimonadaceae bacterium]
MSENLKDADLTGRIIGAFYAVYDKLGYGFLESVYGAGFEIELERHGIRFTREQPVDVFYDGRPIGRYRTDFIIEGRVVVEIKASRAFDESYDKQVLNYLRATRMELGMLLHFGPKPSFKRYIFENSRKGALEVFVNR